MARRLEYVGSGRMRDAETRNLVSAKKVVEEFNEMAERLEAAEKARNAETQCDGGRAKTMPRELHNLA